MLRSFGFIVAFPQFLAMHRNDHHVLFVSMQLLSSLLLSPCFMLSCTTAHSCSTSFVKWFLGIWFWHLVDVSMYVWADILSGCYLFQRNMMTYEQVYISFDEDHSYFIIHNSACRVHQFCWFSFLHIVMVIWFLCQIWHLTGQLVFDIMYII